MIEVRRRGFLVSLGSVLVAAPAIVRAASLDAVRGVKLQIDKWIWRKGMTIESDPYIGYRGVEEYAYRQLLSKADSAAFTEITAQDQLVIDRISAQVRAHKDTYWPALEQDIPLGFRRIGPKTGRYSGYIDL